MSPLWLQASPRTYLAIIRLLDSICLITRYMSEHIAQIGMNLPNLSYFPFQYSENDPGLAPDFLYFPLFFSQTN